MVMIRTHIRAVLGIAIALLPVILAACNKGGSTGY